jgi:hypothetical protein
MSGLLWITGSMISVGGGSGDSGGIWWSGPLVETIVGAVGAIGADGATATGGPRSGFLLGFATGASFAGALGLGRETSLGFAVGALTTAGLAGVELTAGGGGVTGFAGLVVVLWGALVMNGFIV